MSSQKIKCSEWRGQPARYAHLKHDGHFTRVVKDELGAVACWSSKPTLLELPNIDMLANVYRYVPCGTTLLGELVSKSGRASDVKTAINDGDCWLVYFAVEQAPEIPFIGLGQSYVVGPQTPLEVLSQLFGAWGLPFAEFVTIGDGGCDRGPLDKDALLAWADGHLDGKAEGVVLKDGNLLNWRKLKRVRTADLLCVGTTDGDGKFLGLIGSLIVADRDGVVRANVSGMDDDTRVEFTLHEPIGKIIEVEYQYLGAGGKLRHPRFKRVRDDKDRTGITLKEDL